MSGATFAIFADYTKMDMVKTSALRKALRACGARMQVIPNRLFKVAVKELPVSDAAQAISGPTMMIFGSGDVAEAAKTLKTFATAEKLPVVKSGFVEGRVPKHGYDSVRSVGTRDNLPDVRCASSLLQYVGRLG